MTLPNFLIIGAARAGTTSLHHYLAQHPDIYALPRKETNYFAQRSATCFLGDAVAELEAYRAHFSEGSGRTAIGESSPAYLAVPDAPRRIAAVIPDVRLIAILRDPADRAYSHYRLRRRQGRESREVFESVLDESDLDPERSYTERGFYGRFLERYMKYFRRDQVKVFLYDDFALTPDCIVRSCFRFLGVDASFSSNVEERHNANPPAAPLAKETRARLIELYRADILKLGAILDRDLSMWLQP